MRKWVFALVVVRNTRWVLLPLISLAGLLLHSLFQQQQHQKRNFLEFPSCSACGASLVAVLVPENKLVVLCRRSTREAPANSVITAEPSRSCRKQEVASNSCCLQLSSSSQASWFSLRQLSRSSSARPRPPAEDQMVSALLPQEDFLSLVPLLVGWQRRNPGRRSVSSHAFLLSTYPRVSFLLKKKQKKETSEYS